MFYIVTAIILALITIGAFFTGKGMKSDYEAKLAEWEKVREKNSYYAGKKPDPVPGAGMALIPLAILVVFTLFFSITTVDARAVGIQTGFGRYYSTMDNGLHFKAPWTKVEEFTTVLQTTDLEGDQGVAVTFKGGGSGTVNATFRWSIKDDQSDNGAKALWEKYRTFEAVSETLVYRDGKDAILNVANDYSANDARTKQDVIGREIEKRLSDRMERYGIIIDSVSVTSMPLDSKTQASLDKIVSSQNDVERAKADKERAKIDNETAELRKKSGALEEGALQRQCLDVVNNWDVSKNGPLPATFDCSLGGSGKSPVIVDTTKSK